MGAGRSFGSHVNFDAAGGVEAGVERLPDGILRQPDIFGEAVTFVKNVDNDALNSVDLTSLQSANQSNRANTNSDGSSQIQPAPLTPGSVAQDLSSFDGMVLCVVSKGAATTHNGNDGDGPEARAFHASALAWGELLRCAWGWNGSGGDATGDTTYENGGEVVTTAPMLAVAAVAPVAAQGGAHYVRRIDRLLNATRDVESGPPSLWTIANRAVAFRDAVISGAQLDGKSDEPVHLLTPRERWHLHALHQLLQNNHRAAMGAYLRLLELFPGDLLGLSLALDVAYTLGDATSALRAATNVSAYWDERGGGALQPRSFANSLAGALVAVGLSSSSVSSRASTAERLAETAISRDVDGAGGVAVWALSHALAAEGRSSEMVSKLAGYDGTQNYEGCGFLHFHTRMKGYGGIALLDRRGAGADRSTVRLYDGGFGNVLEYSGNDVQGVEMGGEEVCLWEARVPRSIKRDMAGAVGSMFTGWLGGGGSGSANEASKVAPQSGDSEEVKQGSTEQQSTKPKRRTMEDVLCWLPPSPLLLAHATSLLLRLTLCDGVAASDHRWADLSAAWAATLKHDDDDGSVAGVKTPVEYMPMAVLASSLLVEPEKIHNNDVSRTLQCAMEGLHKMGRLLKLGQSKEATAEANASEVEEWREVVRLLSQARDSCQRWEMPAGLPSSTYALPDADVASSTPSSCAPIGWDFNLRQFIEHSLCYAATEVGDYESLCLARAICSEGTTLRSNCPELWWRYGAVLDMLGDEVAAENARAASVSLGSGEGGATF
ncbi:hypothetical protein ACHAXT_010897 [Thalassiosira profunda]